MPGPSTIVTFIDADGDEFPIRVGGHYAHEGQERIDLVHRAGQRLEEFREARELLPTYPVSVGSIENA